MVTSTVLYLALAYVAGTVFGYFVALNKGRRQGIEISLESLIAKGYVKTGVNKDGDIVIYKHWEDKNEKT